MPAPNPPLIQSTGQSPLANVSHQVQQSRQPELIPVDHRQITTSGEDVKMADTAAGNEVTNGDIRLQLPVSYRAYLRHRRAHQLNNLQPAWVGGRPNATRPDDPQSPTFKSPPRFPRPPVPSIRSTISHTAMAAVPALEPAQTASDGQSLSPRAPRPSRSGSAALPRRNSLGFWKSSLRSI